MFESARHTRISNVVALPRQPIANVHPRRGGASRAPFQEILGDAAWWRLPAAVRSRFSRALGPDETRIFAGEVVETSMNVAGRILANLSRLLGAPLPLTPGATGPAHVTVSEDRKLGAQIWTRIYARPGRFPQVISSAKRLSGPTGLEECLGYGLLMRLQLLEDDGALVFRSAGYAVETGFGRTWTLPTWMAPGRCDVVHRDLGNGQFTFTLELRHRWFGLLLRQVGLFHEVGGQARPHDRL